MGRECSRVVDTRENGVASRDDAFTEAARRAQFFSVDPQETCRTQGGAVCPRLLNISVDGARTAAPLQGIPWQRKLRPTGVVRGAKLESTGEDCSSSTAGCV